MKIRILSHSKHPLPAYETLASAGLDLRAKLDHDICLKSLERALIPTGLFVEIPLGYEAQVHPRSGLAAKNGSLSWSWSKQNEVVEDSITRE